MNSKTPWWFTILLVIAAAPMFSFPALLAVCPGDVRIMIWVFPVYIVAAAWLAWRCYPERRAMAWILVALMLLSYPAVYLLATAPLQA